MSIDHRSLQVPVILASAFSVPRNPRFCRRSLSSSTRSTLRGDVDRIRRWGVLAVAHRSAPLKFERLIAVHQPDASADRADPSNTGRRRRCRAPSSIRHPASEAAKPRKVDFLMIGMKDDGAACVELSGRTARRRRRFSAASLAGPSASVRVKIELLLGIRRLRPQLVDLQAGQPAGTWRWLRLHARRERRRDLAPSR